MFTGIITDIGRVVALDKHDALRLDIATHFDTSQIAMGASIACAGVCLTVVDKAKNQFSVDISQETLNKSNLGALQQDDYLNLEQPLKMGDELGGHMVLGHVDGIAELIAVEQIDASHKMTVKAPQALKQFIAQKGSVTLDGVSLTVNDVEDDCFTINLIPHTWTYTSFHYRKAGDKLNLEIDVLARYIARMKECNG